MTQPTSQPTPQPSPAPFRPAPLASIPSSLASYIAAAASGDRSSIFYLFAAIFASARAAVNCLTTHYNSHPSQRTFDTYARLKYCLNRLNAIFYTLRHAPERFLTPGQLRAITRARAVLAHIWRQPVDFSPLTPILTVPEACPPPPRSAALLGSRTASSAEPSLCDHATGPASPIPAASSSPSPSDPLLLLNPGRALASVLLQLAAIYGLSAAPAPAPRPASVAPAPHVGPRAMPPEKAPGVVETATPHSQSPIPNPHSTILNPQSPLRPPP